MSNNRYEFDDNVSSPNSYEDSSFTGYPSETNGIYCIINDDKFWKTDNFENLLKEIDRIVNMYYYIQKNKVLKKIYIFKLENIDFNHVEQSFVMQYKKSLVHIEIILKKSNVVVLGNQKLANETIFQNKIVSEILTLRQTLLNSPKRDVKRKYLNPAELGLSFTVSRKEKLVNDLIKRQELNKILERN
jgi:hypothetical protein